MSQNRNHLRSGWRKIRSASPYTRHSTVDPLGTDPSRSVMFKNLVHALKETTACRRRLSRLLPGVFGPAACGKPYDPREEWRREVIRTVNKVYRELDGLDADLMPLPDNTSEAPKTSALPEDLSELDYKDYHALSPDAQAVLKNEYSSWKTWEKVLQTHKEAFEKQFPNWEQMDSPASAQLRHLRSVYQQSRLGLTRTSIAKGGLLVELAPSDQSPSDVLADKRYIDQGIKVWGEPPPGVPPQEHFIRCSVLASRGLPWGYPSQDAEDPSGDGGQNPVRVKE